MLNVEKLIQKIERERERRLLTQSDLARMAGISRSRVNGVLRRRYSGWPTLRALRDALWPEKADASR